MTDNESNNPRYNLDASTGSKLDMAMGQASQGNANTKEWKIIEKMLNNQTVEQRRSRRWGIFFKLLTFSYLFALLAIFVINSEITYETAPKKHTAIIEVKGIISADTEASADNIVKALRQAFKEPQAKAVIIRINSPGGSPVQAGYVYDEINRLKKLYPEKPVYAVIVDIGASGAYYIAAAADKIYADKASLVGSIGVIAGGFGYVGLMEKLGVERRLYTAGENKAFLDPFSPSNPEQAAFWQDVLNTTHHQFIKQVKKGRGKRLKSSPELFSGLIWTGEQAIKSGLIDELGNSSYVAREVVKAETLVDYSVKPDPWQQVANQLGMSFSKTIRSQMETAIQLR